MAMSAWAHSVFHIARAVRCSGNGFSPPTKRITSGVFPEGIVVGSCTYLVWRALLMGYPRCFTHGEIMRATGLTRGSVDWAIRYLRSRDVIVCLPHRRSGYLIYRASAI
jgi:hypothetical protein